jgi:hypothetical protein
MRTKQAIVTGIIDVGHHIFKNKTYHNFYILFTQLNRHGDLDHAKKRYKLLSFSNHPASNFIKILVTLELVDKYNSNKRISSLEELIGSIVYLEVDPKHEPYPIINVKKYIGTTNLSDEQLDADFISLQNKEFNLNDFEKHPYYIKNKVLESTEYKYSEPLD